jgi:hypothetical protein
MSLIALLIAFIVILVLIWAVRRLLVAFNIGEPIATVVYVIMVVLIVLWLLQGFNVHLPLLR